MVARALEFGGTRQAESLYVHLPFCRRRCYYCDFPVVVVGEGGNRVASATARYVDLVLRELEATAVTTRPLKSCYIGGGTPSLASAAEIGRLLECAREKFGFAEDAEVTLEADPGTFDLSTVKAYCEAGVTRLSVGVQSFFDAELEWAGRAHDAADALKATQTCRDAANSGVLRHGWSMDIISGLPGQTAESWRRTLEKCVAADPWHVSAYDLQVVKGTVFGKWYPDNTLDLDPENLAPSVSSHHKRPALPSENLSADMYAETCRFLTDRGFDHYEISSFSKRRRSVHNALYWEPGKAWLAAGLGATSASVVPGAPYPATFKVSRPRRLSDYAAYVDCLGLAPPPTEQHPSINDALADHVMTSLRTARGLPLARVRALAGPRRLRAVLDAAEAAVYAGLAFVYRDHHRHTFLRLKDPDGFLCSNTIIAAVFAELDKLDDHS